MVAVERTKVHEMAVWSATALEYVKTTGMFLPGTYFIHARKMPDNSLCSTLKLLSILPPWVPTHEPTPTRAILPETVLDDISSYRQ